MDFSVVKPNLKAKGVGVFPIFDDLKEIGFLKDLGKEARIKDKLKSSKYFKGKAGQVTGISFPNNTNFDFIILVGLGKKADLNIDTARMVGAKITPVLDSKKEQEATFFIHEDLCNKKLCHKDLCLGIAEGAQLKHYKFNKLFSDKASEHELYLKSLKFAATKVTGLDADLIELAKVGDGINLTRDLVSMPPNLLNPHTFADECKKLSKLGLKVTILDKKKLTSLGMNALLGVCQGSAFEPKVAIMEWNGDKKNAKDVYAFVGKGVTFDSGGLSLKPPAAMEDMKYDMGGAGVVTGLMKALAGRKAKANVVGVVGLVENMPSGTAQRPGDVVKSMSGQTIEILNTDAEGRLVLADVLWYTQKNYNPKYMVNLATLTGAVVIALGENQYAGMFSNSDKLCDMLSEAGETTNEKVWRLPLTDEYDKLIDSKIADVKNIGARGAGSITAAQFLQRFVSKTPWAHLDIAGVTWDKTGGGTNPVGATGYGVTLLNNFVKTNFEK